MRVELPPGRFSVWVYAESNERHHLPHCHVRWADGETSVALPTVLKIAGDDLPTLARRLVGEHIEEICDAWNALNPERAIE